MNFPKTNLQTIAPMRDAYLKSLPEFQELYLEMMVDNAEFYVLKDQTAAGYAIVTKEKVLVEFYLSQKFIPVCSDVFQSLVNELDIQSVYCKSFDALLLNCCVINNYPYQLLGAHYREFYITEIIDTNGFTIRFAEPQDYPFLLQQESELYETPEELDTFIRGRNVLMFQKDGCLWGCGYLIKVHADFDFYDVGMWVHPDFRKRGIASMIISYLKEMCLKNGWQPIAGCAIDNIASQKTLEKNGFVSKYKLIEFQVSFKGNL